MKNLTRQNPRQLIVAQELINKVKSKCCGIKGNIRDGVKKLYKHTIYDNEYAKKMFLHKGNKVCINKIFSSVKKDWSYWDTNGGHCPFVIRQYKKAIFICHDMGQKLYVEIDGTTEVYQTVDPDGYDTWAFRFRIGKVKM